MLDVLSPDLYSRLQWVQLVTAVLLIWISMRRNRYALELESDLSLRVKPALGASALFFIRPGDAAVLLMGIGTAHKVNLRGTKDPVCLCPAFTTVSDFECSLETSSLCWRVANWDRHSPGLGNSFVHLRVGFLSMRGALFCRGQSRAPKFASLCLSKLASACLLKMMVIPVSRSGFDARQASIGRSIVTFS